jgi:hypothetical protein
MLPAPLIATIETPSDARCRPLGERLDRPKITDPLNEHDRPDQEVLVDLPPAASRQP